MMNQKIENIKKDTDKMTRLLNNASILIERGETEAGNNILIQAEKQAEKIVNAVRLLPNALGIGNEKIQKEINRNIINENNVIISYLEDDVFYVNLPMLLPKKNGGNPIFIRSTLAVALEDFFEHNPKIKLNEPSTIIFRHNYSPEHPEKEWRDHDNIEINVVVDLLALYILPDDSPLKLRHYYCSQKAEEDYTEVFVVPNKKFKEYID